MARTDFYGLEHYLKPVEGYSLLPFRFRRGSDGQVLLTNDLGEFQHVSGFEFSQFVENKLDTASQLYFDLRAKYFLSDDRASIHSRIMASKYRTKKSFLEGFTKLHIFVVSLRCDHSCPYCQVSRQSEDKLRYDMSEETAHRSVDLMLKVPAPAVTCEFQGGEALLNFPLLQEIVRYTKARNETVGKHVDFVICTNLSTLTDDHLEYFKQHNIKISTSLDGPADIHDRNRPFTRGSSHAVTVKNIKRCQEALGKQTVSALMTTTRLSLKYPTEIIDEYLRMDLGSIFVRSLSPYGFAVKTVKALGYTAEEFFEFYKKALDYIVRVNREGRSFTEAYATMLLQKMLTPYPIGFVDLQSPAGAGFGVVVYNYDGDVYASDEARMLAEMGDTSFRLGNVHENSYEDIFFGETMQTIAAASCNEALAGCSDCAYQPYCGADPVYHYATQQDMFGNRATSGFCKKNMAIFDHLFGLLQNGNAELHEIFWSWINQASVAEIRLPEPEWS